MKSLKHHVEYFHIRCNIQLDLPVLADPARPYQLGPGVARAVEEDLCGGGSVSGLEEICHVILSSTRI